MNRSVALLLDLLLSPLTLAIGCWVRRQQAKIVRAGRTLTHDERQWAAALGVRDTERVRVLMVPRIAMPLPHWACVAAQRAGWLSAHVAGMTLGYGIALRADCCRHDESYIPLLVHELTHVAQYERLNGSHGFLRAYVRECVWPGYPRGPLECEAHAAAQKSVAREKDVIPYGPACAKSMAR